MKHTAAEIAQIVGGVVQGDEEVEILAPAKIEEAGPGTITFLGNGKYESYIYASRAAAVIVDSAWKPTQAVHPALIRVDNVYAALATLLQHFDGAEPLDSGIADTAVIDSTAIIDASAIIGHHAVVGPGASIGPNVKIYPNVYIGSNVSIGEATVLYPGVTIMRGCIVGSHCMLHGGVVIGSDGFGFAKDADGAYQKVSQIGNVQIGNHVEIGAQTVIDRATMGSTVIEDGVKLDNLIQVAHNARIGADTVIAAQTGVSGSTQIGKRCIVGGQVGFVGHLQVADDTQIQAQSGIASSIKAPGQRLYGYPAINYSEYLRSYAHFKQLPDLAKKVRQLQQQIDQLTNKD